MEMLKWGIARDLACHPTKRVKVTARRNDVKDELICPFFVITSRQLDRIQFC